MRVRWMGRRHCIYIYSGYTHWLWERLGTRARTRVSTGRSERTGPAVRTARPFLADAPFVGGENTMTVPAAALGVFSLPAGRRHQWEENHGDMRGGLVPDVHSQHLREEASACVLCWRVRVRLPSLMLPRSILSMKKNALPSPSPFLKKTTRIHFFLGLTKTYGEIRENGPFRNDYPPSY